MILDGLNTFFAVMSMKDFIAFGLTNIVI